MKYINSFNPHHSRRQVLCRSHSDGKPGPETLSSLRKAAQQASGRACIQTQVALLRSPRVASHRGAHCAPLSQAGETHLLPGTVQAGGLPPTPQRSSPAPAWCSCGAPQTRGLRIRPTVASFYLLPAPLSPSLPGSPLTRSWPTGASLSLDKC